MTICVTALRGILTSAAEAQAREELARAIQVHGGIVESAPAGQTQAAFGGARPHRDHALRGLRAACDQVEFLRDSEPSTNCSVAIARRDEIASARLLSEHARDGEVLITQAALDAALAGLPLTWEIEHVREEVPPAVLPGLEPAHGRPHHQSVVIGANVSTAPQLAAFRFRCVGLLPADWHPSPIPVYTVERPTHAPAPGQLANQALFMTSRARKVGEYELIELVGHGATAEVWRSRDQTGEVVALKRLRSGADASELERRRFAREGAILARLKHQNICPIRAAGVEEGAGFLVMEFIEGVTLAEVIAAMNSGRVAEAGIRLDADLAGLISRLGLLRRESPETVDPPTVQQRPSIPATLPVPQTLVLMLKVSSAVAHAHSQGVLHRDLKPGNILIRHDGEPVVTDFGLGKFLGPHTSSLSISGHILGTLEYMAPEQAHSSLHVDERADVYALGAILYQLATGRKHFVATGHLLHDAQRLQKHEPPSAREINPTLDPNLVIIIQQALRNDPAERYSSVAEFRADLERYSRGETVVTRTPSLLDRLRARLLGARYATP